MDMATAMALGSFIAAAGKSIGAGAACMGIGGAGAPTATGAAPANTTTAAPTAASSEQPTSGKGQFPPFDATYFPSTLLWLAITFVLLYVLVARVAGPRLRDIITMRRAKIDAD